MSLTFRHIATATSVYLNTGPENAAAALFWIT